MRVLVAFDKFKDALSARAACETAGRVLREQNADWLIDLCPLSDGGDGFEEILGRAAGGERVISSVLGPRGQPVQAGISVVVESRIPLAARRHIVLPETPGREPTLAVIDMASASGLALLGRGLRDPWQTTSFGTGQLIRIATELGAGAILLGVGGSATHDLGAGALSALGLDFLDAGGSKIRPPVPARWADIHRIEGDVRGRVPSIHVACDVRNPLLGPQGAAAVYGPQKGIRAEQLPALEAATEKLAALLCAHCGKAVSLPHAPGSGAAGGMAFGLMCAADAKLVAGVELVSDWLDLDRRIQAADLVITGEGRFDQSSLSGKGPGAVVTRALSSGRPTHVFAGQVAATSDAPEVKLHEITPPDVGLEVALRDAAEYLARALKQTFPGV